MPILRAEIHPANADTCLKIRQRALRCRPSRSKPNRVLRELEVQTLKASDGRFMGSVARAVRFGNLVEGKKVCKRLCILLLPLLRCQILLEGCISFLVV